MLRGWIVRVSKAGGGRRLTLGYRVSLPGLSYRGVALSAHPILAPMFKIGRSIALPPRCACACILLDDLYLYFYFLVNTTNLIKKLRQSICKVSAYLPVRI